MNDFENEIKKDLSRIACSDFKSDMTINEIMKGWHSAKGVELCRNAKYPSAEMMRKYQDEFAKNNAFVDHPDIELKNENCVLCNSVGTLKFQFPEKLYDVILYDDNVVTIEASNYAVVNVHNFGNSVVIIEKDDNSIVNVD